MLLNAAEEEGVDDFPQLARNYLTEHTSACLVFEHGTVREDQTLITSSRRGSGRFVVEVTGRQAHAGSSHQRGASAIRELSRIVERIEQQTDYQRGLLFNVGQIEGGLVSNSVPGRASCMVDLRADTREDYDAACSMIQSLAGPGSVRSSDGDFTCQVAVHTKPGYAPWPVNTAGQKLADLFIAAGTDVGQKIAIERRLGASDGCHLWDLAPTIDGLGPIGRNIHCAVNDPSTGREQESADRDSFAERALLCLAAINRLAAR